MHVAIIAHADHPIREPYAGGLERHTAMLARGLVERGHEVTVFAGEDSTADGYEVRSIGPTEELRLSEEALRDTSMLSQRFLRRHHAYLDLLLELQRRTDLDVVHNNSLHHLPVAMAEGLAMPMTMTLHTPPTPWLESALSLARTTPRCVAVSTDTARRWRHAVEADVIPNAVDLQEWPLGGGGSGRAVWTGRLVPEKGPHLAVAAAREVGMPIDLAGPVSDPDYVQQEVLPRLGEDDRLLGHLDARSLADVVGRAEVQVVTPCWDEPYGLVVPEALACGTPVAAFDRGAMAELLDDRSGRLAPPGDVAALAAAIEEAVGLERADCRRRARDVAALQPMLDGYEELFAEVAA